MLLTRIDIEYQTNLIIEEIANDLEISKDFYGDCLPDEVQHLQNALEFTKDKTSITELFGDIYDILNDIAYDYAYGGYDE